MAALKTGNENVAKRITASALHEPGAPRGRSIMSMKSAMRPAVLLAAFCSAALLAQTPVGPAPAISSAVTPYEVKLETRPGVLMYTFTVPEGQARIYLPDDLAPGEPFTGTTETTRDFILDIGGQSARLADDQFRGVVPANSAAEPLALILRDLRGRELARAALPIQNAPPIAAASAPATARDFRIPEFVQAGGLAPLIGRFDGDARTTQIRIGDSLMPVLAESRRKAVIRIAADLSGPVAAAIDTGGVQKRGETRVLSFTLEGAQKLEAGETGSINLSVAGLAGLNRAVALRLENRSPVPVRIDGDNAASFRDGDYVFIRPSDVRDGAFRGRFGLSAYGSGSIDVSASVIIPQTPQDDVRLILRSPIPNLRPGPSEERAGMLRKLDYDAMPVLEQFLADYDSGSDAAYAMLALNDGRAMTAMFSSVPTSGPNIQRISFEYFLQHYTAGQRPIAQSEAHAAAVRVLSASGNTLSVTQELALHTLGLTGSMEDFDLLEKYYQYRNRLTGASRLHDASEAAMARLGSREHITNIRAELTTPVPAMPTPQQAIRLREVLQKAAFSGQSELVPLVCPHLADPVVVDIDVTYSPHLAAAAALASIVEKKTPLGIASRQPVERWNDYCRAFAKQ
jgi:hypothetical protein